MPTLITFSRFGAAIPVALTILACCFSAFAQDNCLTADEIKNMQAQLKSGAAATYDKKLHDEILKLRRKDQERLRDAVSRQPDNIIDRLKESRDKNVNGICLILKQRGWPTKQLVGDDGADAAFFLIRNTTSPELQAALLPVVIAATTKGEITLHDFAFFIDRVRINAGLKQLFGTQATIRDGFLMMFPIADEAFVDARRKQYQLPPLADYQRTLEQNYRLPLIKTTGALTNLFSANEKRSIDKTTSTAVTDGKDVDEGDVLRVDTNLVSLYVSAFSTKL